MPEQTAITRAYALAPARANRTATRVHVPALGMALGTLFALTYLLCVVFDLWLPGEAMYPVWAPLLPGFSWLTWPSFFLGLVETFIYGWYAALVFGPLYNFFAGRMR